MYYAIKRYFLLLFCGQALVCRGDLVTPIVPIVCIFECGENRISVN